MPTVAVVGTFDTKGAEFAYLCDRLRAQGASVLTVNCGVLSEPAFAPRQDARARGRRSPRCRW